jgi:hypothetical protein
MVKYTINGLSLVRTDTAQLALVTSSSKINALF